MLQAQPFFSIIIPTYNRPQSLAVCLESLTQQDYPRDRFEVIVVDDGSEQPLADVVEPFSYRLDVTLLRQPNRGPATARNTGAAKARGQFLAFTDDDCTPAPDWLKILANQFATASNSIIGGHTFNTLSDNPYSTASQILVDYLYKYYNANHQEAIFFTSNNLALARERFQDIGGFDTTYPHAAAEDREFCDRWLQKGYLMLYVPEAVSYHAHHLHLSSFWGQHFNYGRGAFLFRQVRSRRTNDRIRVEPLSFYINLITYPFAQSSLPRPLLISILLILSQIANVAGFFSQQFSFIKMKSKI